jgi:hypothetical protein
VTRRRRGPAREPMSTADRPPREPQKTRLNCPCGEYLEAATTDALVDVVQAHLREFHPELASTYTREDILWLAR